MKFKISIALVLTYIFAALNYSFAEGLEERTITLKSNERFDLVQASTVTFKFQPLSDDARKLEITNDATALGVAYLGQVTLRENITALSALRSIADQIGESLDISFGVIADSNTSEALKTNELLLLYHPDVTITLALAKPDPINDYEIICTYALKDPTRNQIKQQTDSTPNSQPVAPAAPNAAGAVDEASDIAPVENVPEATTN